jgi:N-acetyl-1-D-myo-inositol-2-amino-2-deoxy-alpha-D-glucopyranoside deacetylase
MTESVPLGAPAAGPLTGRRLLAVFAHPDDESLACGGMLARVAAEGALVTLVCATRGEAGQREPGYREDVNLAIVRREELQEAAACLGIHDVILLDHPDGELPGENFALFRQEMVVAIRHVRPDVVVTFGPDGLYWHPDHIYVHHRVTEAVAQIETNPPALYYVVFDGDAMRNVVEAAAANPDAPRDLSLWDMDPDAFGAYAPSPGLVIDVSAYAGQKLQALRAHRTQVGARHPFSWLTNEQAAVLLGREHFVRAEQGAAGVTFLDLLGTASST